MAGWREVRVFVSSTFRDMHAERDHLVKEVFPKLRERLLPYRIHLVDIDLRWGVTREQAENDEVLDLCLDEIDRCRPFFIGLLGERYGWVPTRYPVRGESKLGWVQAHLGRSVTELEILYGVLDNPAMERHAFFFFRDPRCLDAIPEPLRSEVYAETEPGPKAALKDLKQAIRDSDFPLLEPYRAQWQDGRLTDLDAFGKAVLKQLWQAIQGEHKLPDEPPTFAHDPLAEERDLHQRFAELRRRVYVPRPELHAELLRHLDEPSTKPLVVLGAAGAGKSATLAWLCDHVKERYDLLLPHFVGASSASTDIRRCLLRWCGELQALRGLDDEIPADYAELVSKFRDWLAQVPEDRTVLLVIDALNQLDEANNPHLLAWLPRELPGHVKVIVSALDDPERNRELVRNLTSRAERVVSVGAMTDAERFEVLHAVPSVSARALSTDQLRLFMANPETRNPLYLLVALEELRTSARFETVDQQIADLPQGGDAVTELFVRVIARLESDFDAATVRTVLCALACARAGLPERDLEALADGGDIYPVLRQLRPYLQPRGDKVDFFHRQLFKAVRQRYLSEDEAAPGWHQRLADHLVAQGWTSRLTLEDAVWQQLRAEDWEGVERTLTTLQYLEAKSAAGLVFDLAGDFRAAWQALPAERPWRQNLRLLDEALRRHLQFIDRHRQDYPQALFQCLWNEAWWYDCPEAEKHYEPPEGGWGAAGPPCERGEPKLCALLERWRAEKEARAEGFAWLRQLRPPQIPLGTGQLQVIRGHQGPVEALAVADGGSRLLSGSFDGSVRLWSLTTGVELQRQECGAAVAQIALAANGGSVAIALANGTIQVHQADDLSRLGVSGSQPDKVLAVALAADGATAVWATAEGEVRVASRASSTLVGRLPAPRERIGGAGFDASGQQVAFSAGDRLALLRAAQPVWWPLQRPKLAPVFDRQVGTVVTALAFSADGQLLGSAGRDGSVILWCAASGTVVRRLDGPPRMQRRGISQVAFSPNGQQLAAVTDDGLVQVWSLAEGSAVSSFRLDLGGGEVVYRRAVGGLAFSGDGQDLVLGCCDGTVRVLSATDAYSAPKLRGHNDNHTLQRCSLVFSKDGSRLLTRVASSTRLWESHTARELAVIQDDGEPETVAITTLANADFTEDGSVVYLNESTRSSSDSTSEPGVIRPEEVWDARTGRMYAARATDRPARPRSPRTAQAPRVPDLELAAEADELCVTVVPTGVTIARSPGTLRRVAMHPFTPLWVGLSGANVVFVRLEESEAFERPQAPAPASVPGAAPFGPVGVAARGTAAAKTSQHQPAPSLVDPSAIRQDVSGGRAVEVLPPTRRAATAAARSILYLAVGGACLRWRPWGLLVGVPLVALGLLVLLFAGLVKGGAFVLVSCPDCGRLAIRLRTGKVWCAKCPPSASGSQ